MVLEHCIIHKFVDFLNIESISLSLIIYEKNISERRTIQNIKDRTEFLMTTFLVEKKNLNYCFAARI
jgi:hypothetical protein